MRHTIYLPDDLERQLREHLAARPDATLSSLVQEALRAHLAGKRNLGALLELAGAVTGVGVDARDRAEDAGTCCQ
ncbi:hypothetical protein BH24DEI1_BH24DEI1_04090 [soil metagenome]|jgi:predicted transcriptional regulator|nr:ribbon-helix-helix domain-containing protein [Deinococcota bacterium]